MSHNQLNNIGRFIADQSFRDWILCGDEEATIYWKEWRKANIAKQQDLDYAVVLLKALKGSGRQLSEETIRLEVERIAAMAAEADRETPETAPVITLIPAAAEIPERTWMTQFKRYRAGIAAAVIFLAGIGCYYYALTDVPGKTYKTYETFAKAVRKDAMQYINSSDTVQQIVLEDGSGVDLYTGSRLTYSRADADKREVYLEGEAFFNVIKKPSQPFIVYTDKVVTKVLGTSFIIKAYAEDKRVVVTVRTGKVSVFRRDNFTDKNTKPFEPGGIVVTPNQQVFFDAENKALHKTLIDKPTVLDTVATPCQDTFVFNETPVKEVFARMQKAYGINIVFDEELLDSCSLSARMSTEPFYEKMELICKTLNASYEIIDGNVVITSSGCR